ncbi:DUF4112 domain-containing protein [Candidatus Halobonum tyrrellensis]|uniref:DUF4112 domain-containing protein n=1 Tax=Candidatus Halobonum tyrrellensis G22 TaxID=1324957 RepID=V4HKY8_9EURY|nr:DUF4112 domain-containing protein [Candidatus Halobonum tyrrellensis]ESP88589.1 hypothetical protein K933_09017 [Candidatus Halobonum tyrrellensis G22]
MSLLSRASADADSKEVERRVDRVKWFAQLLDESVKLPVVNYRVGLDAIVGLVPSVGDLITLVASLLIVGEAYRLGAGPVTISRMLVNVGIDTVVGSLPLVGDLFDFAWKANKRNARLLERAVLDG